MQDKTDETDTNDSEPKVKEEMQVDIDELAVITAEKVEEVNPLEIKKEPSESGDTTDQSTPSTKAKEKKEDETEEEITPSKKLKRKRVRPRKRQHKVRRMAEPQEPQTESSNSVVEEETPVPVVMETTVKIEPQVRLQEDVEYVLTVSNMPDTWTYMDIKNYIDTEIEPVDEMELVKDEKTGKGAIRLSYQSEDQCKSAMEKLQAKEIEGNKLTVLMTDTMNERRHRKIDQIQKQLKQLKQQRQRNIKLMQIKEKLHNARMAYLKSKIKSMESYSKIFKRSRGTKQDLLAFSDMFLESDSALSTLAFLSRHRYLSSSSSTSSSSEEELEDRKVVKLEPRREVERESEESSEERETDDSEDSEEESSKEVTTEEERESSDEQTVESLEEETEPSEEYESERMEEEGPKKKQGEKLSKRRISFEESDLDEKESSKGEERESSKENERESSKEEGEESANEGEV